MKRLLITILAFFSLSAVHAQDDYYYYRGNRTYLTINSAKVVSISTTANSNISYPSNGLILNRTISDSDNRLKVFSVPATMTINDAIASFIAPNCYAQPCFTTSNGMELIPDGYINVKLKKSSDLSRLNVVAQQFGCEIIGQNPFMPLWYSLKVIPANGKNSVDIANDIYETSLFAYASPSFSFDALEISYDPDVYSQWALYNSEYYGFDISISQAWSYSTGSGIKIAIVDNGIDMTHPDLVANMYPLSYDTETNTSPSVVYGDHGTHCAGIAAAVRNNGINIAGVAPDAKLMSASVNFASGLNVGIKLANGINWAWQNGADVISCSWRTIPNEYIEEAISNAVHQGRENKGCIIVKSAGNTGGAITYPGDYSADVLAVANMTKTGTLSLSSSHGQNMFVAAPGSYILSTVPNESVAYKTGTSMACPHVAGLAALVLSRNPSLTAAEVREIIASNAKKIGYYPYNINKVYGTWNEYYGYGLIDAYQTVLTTPRD